MEQRIYHGKIVPDALADHLVAVFNQHARQGMYYNHHHTMAQRVGKGDQVMVQIMRSGSWGSDGGTLGVSISRVPGGVSVSLGQSNWLDVDGSTLAGMVVGALFFPPLLLLPLLSGLVRSTFDQDVWDVVHNYCIWSGRSSESAPPPHFFRCPYCGAYNNPDVTNCLSCSGPFNYSQPDESPAQRVSEQPSASASTPGGESQEASDLEASAPEAVVCSKCGVTVPAANFCGNCAASLR